ncbi:hypothetical protein B566_EDAN009654 [Ephemera danica]|nr:hypothetical protein B566_EDAN009654 [Ephemera danica]
MFMIHRRMGSLPELSVVRGDSVILPRSRKTLLHRVFEAAARQCGNQSALLSEDPSVEPLLTFSQLDSAATRLARVIIRHAKSASPSPDGDFIVAVSLSPGAPLIITLLASWKAGAAYMPVEPGIPPQRAAHILADSTPLFVIAENDALQGHASVLLYSELEREASELCDEPIADEEVLQPELESTERIATVLYTSGSTGSPKGVRLPHRAVLNRLRWQWREFPFTDDEQTCVFKTALSFVDSVGEMFAPLLQGRALALLPRAAVAHPERLARALGGHKIRRLVLVPSLLRALLLLARQKGGSGLRALRLWVCSGEELALDLVRDFFAVMPPGAALANFYGSTEVMGDVTYHLFSNLTDVEVAAKNDIRAPIGRALDNTNIYLLDDQFRLVPAGQRGELYAAGLNIARGYVNNRDPSKFLPNPVTTDPAYAVLYRTGDYARLVKGVLVYEGRADSQVKVRGNRVDLSEVERALRTAPGVEKAVVLCWRSGREEQTLLGYVTTSEPMPAAQIEASLRDSLASYAIPQVFVLDSIPLLVNGKTDRQLLLQRFEQQHEAGTGTTVKLDLGSCPAEMQAAAVALLTTVRNVLGAALRTDFISLDANFYEIGGNSLNSIFTITKLQELGFFIGIGDFVSSRTLFEVLKRMNTKPDEVSACTKVSSSRYTTHFLSDESKSSVYRMITESFYQKADLEQWLKPIPAKSDYHDLLDALWPHLLDSNLSFTVRGPDGRDIAVALSFDAHAEPEVQVHSQLAIVFDFLESIEGPIRETRLPTGRGNVLHSFMLGTDPDISSAENVELTQIMEQECLRIARDRGFRGIFTTNTSPLTQQLCTDVYGYEMLLDYQVNQYVAPDGSKPFAEAPDSQRAICSWRRI